MIARVIGIALAGVMIAAGTALAAEPVRVGVLKSGTVNWEIDTIDHYGLDEAEGIDLKVMGLAGNDATRVALLAGDVDVIVSDWLFVSRQRAEGEPLTFVPYSTSVGAVMVPCQAGLKALPELKGKRIGVAGGPLDKSWLMLRGLAQGEHGFDLAAETEQVFGAPPLLAEQLRQGQTDASLNYWHYNARLEAEGYCPMVSAQEAARALGAQGDISAIGYVFSEDWAEENFDTAMGFVRASRAAKEKLARDDAAWERLRPMMNAENDAVFERLKARYREGVPTRSVAEEERDTAKVYEYLARKGGEKLVGPAETMAPGTFWSALTQGS